MAHTVLRRIPTVDKRHTLLRRPVALVIHFISLLYLFTYHSSSSLLYLDPYLSAIHSFVLLSCGQHVKFRIIHQLKKKSKSSRAEGKCSPHPIGLYLNTEHSLAAATTAPCGLASCSNYQHANPEVPLNQTSMLLIARPQRFLNNARTVMPICGHCMHPPATVMVLLKLVVLWVFLES